MATKTYCDICGIEITGSPVEEKYELQIRTQDHWNQNPVYNIMDMCRTCYLDIYDSIKRKIEFYQDKHIMEDGCQNIQ